MSGTQCFTPHCVGKSKNDYRWWFCSRCWKHVRKAFKLRALFRGKVDYGSS